MTRYLCPACSPVCSLCESSWWARSISLWCSALLSTRRHSIEVENSSREKREGWKMYWKLMWWQTLITNATDSFAWKVGSPGEPFVVQFIVRLACKNNDAKRRTDKMYLFYVVLSCSFFFISQVMSHGAATTSGIYLLDMAESRLAFLLLWNEFEFCGKSLASL